MYLRCLNMYSGTSRNNIYFTYPEQREVYFLANIPNPSLMRKDSFPPSTRADIAVTQMFPAFLFLCGESLIPTLDILRTAPGAEDTQTGCRKAWG